MSFFASVRKTEAIFMMYILLVVGFVLLIKGADFFVDGASSVAKLASRLACTTLSM